MRKTLGIAAIFISMISFTGRAHGQAKDPPDDASLDKPWRLSISAGLGWTDNVVTLDDSLTLGTPGSTLPFASSRDAAFARFTLDFAYDVLADDEQILTLGYHLHADVYEGSASEFDEHDHFVWAGYQRKLADQFVGSIKLTGTTAIVDGDTVRNAMIIEPSLIFAASDWLTLELISGIELADFKTPLPFGGAAAANRDGETYAIGGAAHIDVPDTSLRLYLAYLHRWTFTTGGAFDFDEDRIIAGLAHPLPWEIQADLRYTFARQRYDGLGPRRDEAHIFSLYFTKPINENVSVYLRYDHINNQSNGVLFEYRQNLIAAGVTIDF